VARASQKIGFSADFLKKSRSSDDGEILIFVGWALPTTRNHQSHNHMMNSRWAVPTLPGKINVFYHQIEDRRDQKQARHGDEIRDE